MYLQMLKSVDRNEIPLVAAFVTIVYDEMRSVAPETAEDRIEIV